MGKLFITGVMYLLIPTYIVLKEKKYSEKKLLRITIINGIIIWIIFHLPSFLNPENDSAAAFSTTAAFFWSYIAYTLLHNKCLAPIKCDPIPESITFLSQSVSEHTKSLKLNGSICLTKSTLTMIDTYIFLIYTQRIGCVKPYSSSSASQLLTYTLEELPKEKLCLFFDVNASLGFRNIEDFFEDRMSYYDMIYAKYMQNRTLLFAYLLYGLEHALLTDVDDIGYSLLGSLTYVPPHARDSQLREEILTYIAPYLNETATLREAVRAELNIRPKRQLLAEFTNSKILQNL